MNLSEAHDCYKAGGIPDVITTMDAGRYFEYVTIEYAGLKYKINSLNIWCLVAMDWITKMAGDWIGDAAVLEVMAGSGAIAKAMQSAGVWRYFATDDDSWNRMRRFV